MVLVLIVFKCFNIAEYTIRHAKKKEPNPQLANIITSINKSKKINPSNRTVTGSLPGSLQGQEMIKGEKKIIIIRKKKLRENKVVAQNLTFFSFFCVHHERTQMGPHASTLSMQDALQVPPEIIVQRH